MMRVALRCDASLKIGTGHVMRCATLAKELIKQKAEVYFICRSMPGDFCDWLENQNFKVLRLPYFDTLISSDERANSNFDEVRFASEEQDAIDTLRVLEGQELFDWFVVDHYCLGGIWEAEIRIMAKKILAIDDLYNRNHDCDLLLNQNYLGNPLDPYKGQIPDHCCALLGPEFSLLQREYAELHQEISARSNPVRNILVSFGGHGYVELIEMVINTFLRINKHDIDLDIVLSESNSEYSRLSKYISNKSNIHLYGMQTTLAHMMAKADLAIGAGGSTTWERLCMGLPSLVITLAKNQVAIAKELSEQGLVNVLGNIGNVDEKIIFKALTTLLNNPQLGTISRNCLNLVDGRGALRIASIMAMNKLQVRSASMADVDLLYRWVNDPVVKASAFNSTEINFSSHQRWLQKRLTTSETCHIYVVQLNEYVPVGQVRFDLTDGDWIIDYSIDSLFRGRGLGKKVLKSAIDTLVKCIGGCVFIGKVKSWNTSSKKVFDGLGFEAKEENDMVIYRLEVM